MTYELALELKNAGFPQRKEWDEGYFYCEDCKDIQLFKNDPDEHSFVGENYSHRWQDWPADNWTTVPTLEELIESCEKKGQFVLNCYGHGKYIARIGYYIESTTAQKMQGYPKMSQYCEVEASTLTEVVARLWLELNKKI